MAGHPFTPKDWEQVLHRNIEQHERKKETFLRWTAAGITGILALLYLALTRIASINLGQDWLLTLILLSTLAYLAVHAGWEIVEEPLLDALLVIVSVGKEPWTARDLLKTVVGVSRLRPADMLLSHPTASAAVTGMLGWELWSNAASPSAGPLLQVVSIRIATLVALLLFFGWLIRVGRRADPAKAKVPRHPRARIFGMEPDAEVGKGAHWLSLIAVAFYALQVWLLWPAVVLVVPMTHDILLLWVLFASAAVLALWVRGVTWPMVQRFSGVVLRLKRVYRGVVLGELADSDAVLRELEKEEAGEASP